MRDELDDEPDEEREFKAEPYEIYVFDCPMCGSQAVIGSVEPESEEECDNCHGTIQMKL